MEIVCGPSVVEWVAGRLGESGNFGGCAVGIGVKDRKLLAGVVYCDYNGASCCMHVAAEPKSNWLTRATLRRFFAYPFLQLGLNVVIATVTEANVKSRKLVEGVGFVMVHRIPDAHPSGAMLIYTMTRATCRWIGNHGKE